MISKELLSEVLGKKVESYMIVVNQLGSSPELYDGIGEHFISMTLGSGVGKAINIYELAGKCKEWAKNNGFFLQSGIVIRGKIWCEIYKPENLSNTVNQFGSIMEPEAIFKACEWILTQKATK